jgi:hypothetical protein
MAKIKKKRGKYPVRSMRISDPVFAELQRKKKRGESWDKFLKEQYGENKN